MATRLRINNVKGAYNAMLIGDTSITLTVALPAAAVPVAGTSYLPVTLDADSATEEIVWITGPASSGTTYPVSRAQESTTAVAHSAGSYVHGPTAFDFPKTLDAYSSTTTYAAGDEVSYLGDIFKSSVAQTGVAPSRGSSFSAPTAVQQAPVVASNPTFSAATSAANSIVIVAFGSGTPPASPPAGFTLVYNTGVDTNTGQQALYYLNSSPGAVTNVAMAAAGSFHYLMLELTGAVQVAKTGLTASTSAGSTTLAETPTSNTAPSYELIVVCPGNTGAVTPSTGATQIATDGGVPANLVYGATPSSYPASYTFSGPTYTFVSAVQFQSPVAPSWTSVVGPYVPTVTAVAATYTMAAGDNIVLANGTITVTLPAVAAAKGRYTVKNIGTGAITIAPASGTIDGAANASLAVQYSSLDVVTDGTNWFTV